MIRTSLKLIILLSIIAICQRGNAQQPQFLDDSTDLKTYILKILEDTANYWSEYPKPPPLADNVLPGMEKELTEDDSAKRYFEKLSFAKFSHAIDYENAFAYINKKDYDYTLLALAVHWNPDLRVSALIHLNKKLTLRPLINSPKMKNGEWQKFDKIAIEFLVYVLERNPLFISGSENATIHGLYISNILWDLDLLTHENIVGNKPLRDWYKNDLQFETAVMQWKAHLK